MNIKIIPIDPANPFQVKQFLTLPFLIYQDNPQWVPPLASEARRILDRKRNPFYQHSQAAFFLAYDEHQNPLGRLAVLDNKNYNAYNHEQTAFFYCFECKDNKRVSQGLFEAGFSWAQQRGLDKIRGPKGFSTLDGMGLLVKGFEHRPAFGIPYNPPYYPALVEAAGFQSEGDIVSGYLDTSIQFPEKIHRISELVQRRRGLTVARYRSRRDLRSLIPRLQELYNTALEGTTGNVPLTDKEAKTMADQLLWFANPRLIKIVMKDDQPVGFLFAYPDISAAMQRTQGHLFPFGWLTLLLELHRTKWVNINGVGIIEQYRGLGGTAILFSEIFKSIVEGGFKYSDLVQIGAENDNMQRELRDLGIVFYKTHRIYQRPL